MKKRLLTIMLALAAVVTGARAEDVTSYGFLVGGVLVTSENAANITGENILQGTVSYDVATHTLTLDNAVIGASGTGCIEGYDGNNPTDLTLRLIGENQFVDGYEMDFYWWVDLDLTFTSDDGTGSLTTVKPYGDDHGPVYGGSMAVMGRSTITIDNCTVELKMVWRSGGDFGPLTIKNNGTLKVQESIECSDRLFDENIGVIQPAGAWWSESGRLMVGEGESATMAENVIIGPRQDDTVGVAPVAVLRNTGAVTYSLQGLRVERPAKGLYIQGGRKVVVK